MRKMLVFIFLLTVFKLNAQPLCFENREHPVPLPGPEAKLNMESKLAEALANYQKDSSNADHIIWLGRRIAYLGQYDEAIRVFSRGIALHPADARMYRHRGHRYITLRCFDKAIADLEKAASLVRGKKDEIEPDGIPNAKNIPVSTLQTNIWYHLGLAYFLTGDLAKAEVAYQNGLATSNNDDMQVAMTNWLYISLLSRNKPGMADSVFKKISLSPELTENKDYLSLLYFYVHKPAESEIGRYTDAVIKSTGKTDTTSVSAATLYFGAGYYAKLKGMKAKATMFFKKAIATGQWSSFGYIAAEAELNRIR